MPVIKEPISSRRKLPTIKLSSFGNLRKSQIFWLAFKNIAYKYAEDTKVNAFFYLKKDESKGFKRIFWILILFVTLSFGGVILSQLIRQFFEVPFQLSINAPEPLLSIPFPSISICHPQTVINYKAEQFVETLKIRDDMNKSDILESMSSALGVFTENQWGPIDVNKLQTINDLFELNGLNILDAVTKVGIDCKDLIIRCSVNKQRFPCFQNLEHRTFRQTMSQIGICCSFNYNPYNVSYLPLHINSYGVRGGLTLIGTTFPHVNDGRSGSLFSNGFILLMHSPYDFPTDTNSMALLGVGKVTSVAIYPTVSTVSDDVKALPTQSRRCLIGKDVGLNIYRQPACAMDCMRKYIYEKCTCHPYYLPRDDRLQIRDCKVMDGECFSTIFNDLKKIRCKSCLPSCDDLTYKISTSNVPYSFANTTINPLYEATNVTKYEFTAHIYFAVSTVRVLKRIITLSFLQLLSNFGGVFNLCLGISLISIVELIYYFCFKLPQYMKNHTKVIPIITAGKPRDSKFR